MEKENKEKKFYSFKYDKVFKAIFASEEDKELKLLSALIEECIESKIENLKLLKTELNVRTTKEKSKRLDLIAESSGKKLNIELNTSTELVTTIRNLNYFMAFCSENAVVGEKYDTESEFIHISLNYGMSMKEPLFYCFYLYDPKNKKFLSEKYKIFIVNIEKFSKLWYDKNEEVSKKPILAMLGINEEAKIDTFAKELNNGFVKESVIKLKRLNQDVDFVYGISPEEDDILIENTRVYLASKEAREEGIEIGEKIGEQRGKVVMCHELGLSINEIIDKTGLTKEEINNILNS